MFTLPTNADLTEDVIVFTDKMAIGWEDWSWDCRRNLASRARLQDGKPTIEVTLQAYGGLAFAYRPGIDTTGYKALELLLHGGEQGVEENASRGDS